MREFVGLADLSMGLTVVVVNVVGASLDMCVGERYLGGCDVLLYVKMVEKKTKQITLSLDMHKPWRRYLDQENDNESLGREMPTLKGSGGIQKISRGCGRKKKERNPKRPREWREKVKREMPK